MLASLPSLALGLALLVPASAAAHSPLVARQATATTALAALQNGPATLIIGSCTTTCTPMLTQANTCTQDGCACAAVTQTTTCMNCVVAGAGLTAAFINQAQTGFEAYAQACFDEGLITVIPALTLPATATSVSSALPSSASRTTSRLSSSAVATSSAVASSSAAVGAGTGTTSTLGYTAFQTWLGLFNGYCATACTPVTNEVAACSTDACLCTQQTLDDGAICQACALQNAEGGFTPTQLSQLQTDWSLAQTRCGLVGVAPVNSAATLATQTLTTNSNGGQTPTGTPRQSFYEPTYDILSKSTTSGVTVQTAAVQGGSSAATSRVAMGWSVGCASFGAGVAGLLLVL